MPDFNKGDFTQQGVNGHVNANVRLNEKRLVNIDMTSNEAAEGCTITGTVKDLLNDKVYAVGAAKTISSKTLTANGTYYATVDNCDGYNPVTVNVPAEIPYIIQPQTVTTLSSGYRELPLGANLGSLSLGDHAVLKLSGTYYGTPVSGYIIGTVMNLTPGDEAITFADDVVIAGTPTSVQIDVINTPSFSDYEWGILLLINNTQTAMTDIEVSAVAW